MRRRKGSHHHGLSCSMPLLLPSLPPSSPSLFFSSPHLPVLQGNKTMSHNSVIRVSSCSWLCDWNSLPRFFGHMAIWICSLWRGPVTLRLRLPGMPPQLASVREDQWGFNVSVLLTLSLFHPPSPLLFPSSTFPPQITLAIATIILVCNTEGFRSDCIFSVKTLGCLLKASAPWLRTAALLWLKGYWHDKSKVSLF